MRTIVESTLVSADGVIGDPPQWAMGYRDEEVQAEALARLSGSDAMLMGRATYELFFPTSQPGAADARRRGQGWPSPRSATQIISRPLSPGASGLRTAMRSSR